MTLRALCGSGLAKANPRFTPEVSRSERKSLCLGGFESDVSCSFSQSQREKKFMSVKASVFASKAERENFYKLSRHWGKKWHLHHNLPFLNLFDLEKLFETDRFGKKLGSFFQRLKRHGSRKLVSTIHFVIRTIPLCYV
jgi:hypothetical protein